MYMLPFGCCHRSWHYYGRVKFLECSISFSFEWCRDWSPPLALWRGWEVQVKGRDIKASPEKLSQTAGSLVGWFINSPKLAGNKAVGNFHQISFFTLTQVVAISLLPLLFNAPAVYLVVEDVT